MNSIIIDTEDIYIPIPLVLPYFQESSVLKAFLTPETTTVRASVSVEERGTNRKESLHISVSNSFLISSYFSKTLY